MAIAFTAPRHVRIVLALLAFAIPAGAHAEDVAPPSQQQSVGPPPGQKGGGPNTRTSPAAAEQHALPPDSATKQTLSLPGRTLAFTATAGSIRLFDDKGEPQADLLTPAISSMAPTRAPGR